jgi:hypothetical protein
LVSCDGSDSTILANRWCDVPILTLLEAPFNLDWGSSIYAIVSASNSKGESVFSNEGNGAVILTNPDAPTDIQSDQAASTGNTIALIWTQGATGGAPITMYRIAYDQGLGTDQFVVLATGITTQSYTATGLNAGVIYKFKI